MSEPAKDTDAACACDAAVSISAHVDARVRRLGSVAPATLHATTLGLLDLLGDPRGRTVLELGSGRGGLLLELLRRGATRVTGVELSGVSNVAARARLEAAGLADRATLQLGDGASLPLEPHDWVVLDRVICCYPDLDGILRNASHAARHAFAFSVPDSQGWHGTTARLICALDDAWNRFRRRPCTTYVHDLGRIEAALERAGFTQVGVDRRGLWYLALFERRPGSTAAWTS